MQNPTLFYPVQEDSRIFIELKDSNAGHWRIELDPLKALDVASQLTLMATHSLRQAQRKEV